MRIPCVPVALPTLAALAPVASVAMLVAASCTADLLLNEVLYDPAGADEGYEFVELWKWLRRRPREERAMRRAGQRTALTFEWTEVIRRLLLPRLSRGDAVDTTASLRA